MLSTVLALAAAFAPPVVVPQAVPRFTAQQAMQDVYYPSYTAEGPANYAPAPAPAYAAPAAASWAPVFAFGAGAVVALAIMGKKQAAEKAVGRRAALQKAVAAAAGMGGVQAARADRVIGVNGSLDFGPLAGDQPGGEGTGKALGIDDTSLSYVLIGVFVGVGAAFGQWSSYQEDQDDFFDAYESRRVDKDTGPNRVRR